jgi:Tol biopolymer transport system component
MWNRAGSAIYPKQTAGVKTLFLFAATLLVCVFSEIAAAQSENVGSVTSHGKTGAILFGSLASNLWVINSDGSELRNLTNFPTPDHVAFSASWSPDATRIAFVDYRPVNAGNVGLMSLNVWVMNADGTGVKPLTGDPRTVFYDAVWAPDGHKLASVCQLLDVTKDKQIVYQSTNICVVNTDGSGAVPLTRFTNRDIFIDHVAWSPDGRKIAFFSNRALQGSDEKPDDSRSRNLWVMDADGSHALALTHFTEWFTRIEEMAWSPNSRKIAYVSVRALDGGSGGARGENIWITNADGSGSFPLTRFSEARCRGFSWSPDGSRVSFSSNAGLDGADTSTGAFNIWTIKLDGSSAMPLTSITERITQRPTGVVP